jgi:hypothetical protein
MLQLPPAWFVDYGTPRSWALAAAALLTETNAGAHDILGGHVKSAMTVEGQRRALAEWWGVYDEDDLIEALAWIETEGHRKSFEELGAYVASLNDEQLDRLEKEAENDPEARNQIALVKAHYGKLGEKSLLGWDYSRYIALCGWGFLAGYFTEDEAWERIMPVARGLQATFESWEDLGTNYLVGREFWSYEQTEANGGEFRAAYARLVESPSGPWQVNPWVMDLREAE